jgi:branched-chain amino acid transport system substrate-binding protein
MLRAELAREELKGKKIAVVRDKTTYRKGLADAPLDNMHKLGVKEVLYRRPGRRRHGDVVRT